MRFGINCSCFPTCFFPIAVKTIHVFVGLFLVGAVLLKLLTATDPHAGFVRFLPNDVLQNLVLGMELIVGVLLISGAFQRESSWVAIGLFLGFAIANVVMIAVGVSECGCFGRFSLAPTNALLIDLGFLVLLFGNVWYFRFQSVPTNWSNFLQAFAPAAVTIATLTLGALVATTLLDTSLENVASRSWGTPGLTMMRPEVNVGAIEQSARTDFFVVLQNNSSVDATVVGGRNTCSTKLVSELPIKIPPKGVAKVGLAQRGTGTKGFFSDTYLLFVQDVEVRTLPVRISGVIR